MYQVGYTQGEQDAANGIYNPPASTTEEPDLQVRGYKDGHLAATTTHQDDMEKHEPLLPMNHRVYCGTWYLVNGHPVRSEIEGNCQDLLDDLKLTGEDAGATEVYWCDAGARGLPQKFPG